VNNSKNNSIFTLDSLRKTVRSSQTQPLERNNIHFGKKYEISQVESKALLNYKHGKNKME